MEKKKEKYMQNLEKDQLVAFNACGKMLSGKVQSVTGDSVVVETKRGIVFHIMKDDIAWIKTGERWPKGIYYELKRSVGESNG